MNEDFLNNDLSEEELVRKLNDKYFLLAINDAVAFSKLIVAEIPYYFDKYEIDGFTLSELKSFSEKFIEYNVTAIFMKFDLMNDMVYGNINLGQLYTFKPLIGTEKKGILLPEPYDVEIGKPKRTIEIDDIDINLMDNKLDAFNSGKISFDEFLGSL